MKTYPSPNVDMIDSVSPELKDFIKCMLQKDTEKRWTASGLLQHQFIVQYYNQFFEDPHLTDYLAQYNMTKKIYDQSFLTQCHNEFL